MAFGGFDDNRSQPMAEINTTPLVDVMLVLLVIFIITAPLFNQAIPIDLPKVVANNLEEKPLVLHVALDAHDQLFLDDAPIDADDLELRFKSAAPRNPELHLRADRNTRYEAIARIMAAAQAAGVGKIAFVTDPAPRTAPP